MVGSYLGNGKLVDRSSSFPANGAAPRNAGSDQVSAEAAAGNPQLLGDRLGCVTSLTRTSAALQTPLTKLGCQLTHPKTESGIDIAERKLSSRI